MEIREISFYKDFKCLGGDCPETCCMGWLIPLEKEDLARYADEKGWLKLRLLAAISEHSSPVFNSDCRECPFHNRKGLCDLQLKRGHDYIPEVCRTYPRFFRNYGPFGERCIDLSCIAGARLFMNSSYSLGQITVQDDPDCECTYTNEDTDFLGSLVSYRESMINALMSVRSYEELAHVMNSVDICSRRLQEAFLKNDAEHIPELIFNIDAYPDNDLASGYMALPKGSIFPMSSAQYRYLMHSSVYGSSLSRTNPRLYHLFSLYNKKYYRRVSTDDRLDDLFAEYKERHPGYARLYAAYYAYYLYEYFLQTYEDYSFIRHTRIGAIHVSMILMFDMLYDLRYSSLSDEDFAHILSVYNRRAYFNDTVIDDMYAVFT